MRDPEQPREPTSRETGAEADSEAAPLVDGTERPVDPRTVRVARMIGVPIVSLISLVPIAVFTIGWAVGGIPGRIYLVFLAVWLVLLSTGLLIAYRLPAARHRHLRYLVEDDGLRIRRGVFWRKVIWIPITRVQHTDVSQGPLQRRYGLGTLTVHTAGTAGASISLAGLEHGIADRLSNHLRPARQTGVSSSAGAALTRPDAG